jgi:Uma2 family endonuclease
MRYDPPMGTPYALHRYTFQDYLALEEISTVKHEFLAGEIYALAGGSVLHAALSAAMVALLHGQIREHCRVYSSDLRIRVLATGLAGYADAAVVCGPVETDPENTDTVTNPAALVEVLSPGTIDYDLGEKREQYKQIPAARVLIYVWQDRRQIELCERAPDGWRTQVVGQGQTAVIESLPCGIDVDALYAGVGGP